MIGQSKTGTSSQIIFITLFSSMCTYLLACSPASANRANMQKKNYFPEPNKHMLTFLHPILIVEGCMLSTDDGDDASDYNQECLSSTSWTWSWFSSTSHHLFMYLFTSNCLEPLLEIHLWGKAQGWRYCQNKGSHKAIAKHKLYFGNALDWRAYIWHKDPPYIFQQ